MTDLMIILADGTEMGVLGANVARGSLFITLADPMGVKAAADLFSDAEKTRSITRVSARERTAIDGYTGLFGVLIDQFTGKTQVFLRREG